MLAISGQVGHADRQLVDGGFAAQLRQALENTRDIVSEHGGTVGDVMKMTVMLAQIDDLDEMNSICGEFFGVNVPAITVYAVSALPLGAQVQVDAWAKLRTTWWHFPPGTPVPYYS